MDWILILTNAITGVGIAGVLGSAAAFVAKSLGERWLDKRVELFKEQLARESTEHRVRFETLHAKRAEVIVESWTALRRALAAGRSFVAPMQAGGNEGQLKTGEEAEQLAREARKFLYENLIFFPREFADRLYEFSKELDVFCFTKLMEYRDARAQGRNPYFEGGRDSGFGAGWKEIENKIKPILTELERELRAMLGVEPRPLADPK